MMLKPSVVEQALEYCKATWGPGFTVFFSPQGIPLTQPVLQQLAHQLFGETPQPATTDDAPGTIANPITQPLHLILVCPRYEGMDARVEEEFADLVVSIGDYVLMGGDLPAQVFIEGLLRHYPGVVGKAESVNEDSFSGPFLDHPEYGLPVTWHERTVPEIVRSGNHEAIRLWRKAEAATKTLLKRFDWFRQASPSAEACAMARKSIPLHYVVLMHDQIKIEGGSVGTTSVTSIDIHDTARSCTTYGITNFFIVTPLVDQLSIVHTFLGFWQTEVGKNYNESRYKAISRVKTAVSLEAVLQEIQTETGHKPVIITTSAKQLPHAVAIDFYSQGAVWQHNRPVVLLFGTGQGLADAVIEQSDFLLLPVTGMTPYNHLSVRSAMAIILDRWLGLSPRLPVVKNGIAKCTK